MGTPAAAAATVNNPDAAGEQLRRVGVRNPVFVLDEVDRLDEAGGASAAVLEAVDPMRCAAFCDRYLDLPFDLSEALFVAMASRLGSVPPALRERMRRVVELPGYTEAEKRVIAARGLLPGLLRLHELTADEVEVAEEAVGAVIRGYTWEAGVWRLAAALGEVCVRVVRRRAEGDESRVVVTPEQLAGLLGAPVYPASEVAGRTGRPGVDSRDGSRQRGVPFHVATGVPFVLAISSLESPLNCLISTASTSIPAICALRNSTTRSSGSGMSSATNSSRRRAAARLMATRSQKPSASGSSSPSGCNSFPSSSAGSSAGGRPAASAFHRAVPDARRSGPGVRPPSRSALLRAVQAVLADPGCRCARP